jgi:hypothetical protein
LPCTTRYDGDVKLLGKVEQFYLEVMTVADYGERLKCAQFRMRFGEQKRQIEEDLQVVRLAIQEVRRCVVPSVRRCVVASVHRCASFCVLRVGWVHGVLRSLVRCATQGRGGGAWPGRASVRWG